MKTMNFGEHLTLDGYGGDKEKLDNREKVLQFLMELPKKTGMHPITEPSVVHAEDNGIKDPGGWSGYVIIAESHISIHTFPGRGFVSADVYTCKNGMDTETILSYFQEMFALDDVESNFIKRGTKYPAENI